ncbi:MAG TPA: S53 family peptidase [Kofleriaceae bacterium]|nr:S53 family peptidase [Kofleriaceae bacterium]
MSASPESGHSFVPLPRSQRELLTNSRSTGPINPEELATITIRTRAKAPAGDLEKFVDALYAKPLADRTYLTRAELAAQYGAHSDDLDAVEHYAQRHNLVVVHRSAAERAVSVRGRLGDLLHAFRANVRMYDHATGTYRGRQGEIHVPKALDGVITGIHGYDTRRKHRLPHRIRTHASGPGGQNGVAATEFATRYNFPTDNGSGAALDGTGQCVAIVELGGGFNNGDLDAFFSAVKVERPDVVAVSVDRAKNGAQPNDADGEVMLDIEVAGAVVPKAKFAVYFGPNQGAGFLDVLSAAVHDSERNPSVISVSWGGPEEASEIQSFRDVFLAAAAIGVTVCVASGDHGTADLDGGSWDQKIHVDHPAVDPYVLGCGGTQIDAHGVDVAWNDGTPFSDAPDGGGWATGGGISEIIPVPAYQVHAEAPVSLVTGKPGRAVPDIAMSATNYYTRVDGSEGASGGTSAVAPLMAGLVARLNQAKAKPVGFLNPFLYNNVSKGVVHRVTSGSNAIEGSTKGYSAGMGCTGLGIPDGKAILSNL